MDNVIEVRNVSKSFGKHHILRGVDLNVPKGKITVLMGLSGTGKSVLLKAILGLLTPDAGTITIYGVDFQHAKRKERGEILRRLGMCFQNAALFDSMNARENVAFPLREHLDLEEPEINSRVDEVLHLVGLDNLGVKNPSELSGGMRKRVGLARALVLKPDIILFDEPTTGLDPILSDVIIQNIKATHESFGYTSIIVTHELRLTFEIGDHVALLLNGKIAFDGTAEEFKNCKDPSVRQFIAGQAIGPIEVQ